MPTTHESKSSPVREKGPASRNHDGVPLRGKRDQPLRDLRIKPVDIGKQADFQAKHPLGVVCEPMN